MTAPRVRASTAIGRRMVLWLLLASSLLTSAVAQAQFVPSEYDLKAAFIYQFISYISWPEAKAGAPDAPLRIGVVGASELADNLAMLAMAGKTNERDIEVVRLQPGDAVGDLHVLFVAGVLDAQAQQMLASAAASAVLTITESTPRAPASMINFEVIDSKVRFDVALGLAQQNGVAISARLLQVALRVVDLP